MPQEFRYPLTRYCLRGGALTLPRAMVGLFPESGEVLALDTKNEAEHKLEVLDARTISGFGPMFKQHRLNVNDELLIRPLEDGRFAFTPVKREHKPDYSDHEAIEQVLDELIAASVPVTEAEVRALYPGISADVALGELFEADERFVRREGRWHNALNVAYPLEPAPAASQPGRRSAGSHSGSSNADTVLTEHPDDQAGQEELVAAAPGRKASAAQAVTPNHPNAPRTADVKAAEGVTDADNGVRTDDAAANPAGSGDEATATALHTTVMDPAPQQHVQAGLWQQDAGGSSGAISNGGAEVGQGRSHGTVLERRRPEETPHDQHAQELDDEARLRDGDAAVADDLDDGASLEVTELSNRLRAVLAPIGFRLEPVARGQLLLTADMGRKGYTVLVQLLTRNDRLDWADLLARRRSTNVRFLAVVGDHRALLRLTNPAELARATLWSWQALDRLATLHRTVFVSPVELESHFERDGLFERGLERFEAAVAKLVAERGAVSELLARLAVMRAPTVFLLEDLAGELKVPRDRLLRLLELLAEAPFHLVSKVDHGEFVLRQRVAASLDNLATYAASLRQRLPAKHVEKLTGLAEPDLLTDAELETQATNGLEPGSST